MIVDVQLNPSPLQSSIASHHLDVVRGRFHSRRSQLPSLSTRSSFANLIQAGASGCVVAARLAQSSKRPSVLLIEAGGKNEDASYRIPADRFALAFKEPSLNWGYKTAPQHHLKGQQIDYSRGKGLGGSTAINFSCWVVGPDEDLYVNSHICCIW